MPKWRALSSVILECFQGSPNFSMEPADAGPWELALAMVSHGKLVGMLDGLMHAVEVACLPGDHHAVDHFANQAAGDFENAGCLEAPEPVRDGLAA